MDIAEKEIYWNPQDTHNLGNFMLYLLIFQLSLPLNCILSGIRTIIVAELYVFNHNKRN